MWMRTTRNVRLDIRFYGSREEEEESGKVWGAGRGPGRESYQTYLLALAMRVLSSMSMDWRIWRMEGEVA